MRYTLLRVTDDGRVVLRDLHERRVPLAGFAARATPGIHAVWLDQDGVVQSETRPASRLHDGMPVRWLPSPLGPGTGQPKPRPPCAYDGVRAPGVATLLTSADGAEILEACSAAVVGWRECLICVPADRPRVWSTSEAAIRAHLRFTEEPLRSDGDLPLLLVNAVKGPCRIALAGRAEFPAAAVREIEALFEALTR